MINQKDDMRGVRRMVTLMGIVLMGGVIVLVYAGFDKIQHQKKQPTRMQRDYNQCPATSDIALPENSTIMFPVIRQDNEIMIQTQQNGITRLLIIDACNGKLLRTMTLRLSNQ